jgi:hypothetical protein
MFRRPSPALVVASLALLVALAGTGYAAVVLPRNSVGPMQLRNGAVSSLKVKDGSLALIDFAAPQRANLKGDPGVAGPKGDTGAKGDKGDKGDKGSKGDPGLSGYVIVQKGSALTTASSTAVQVDCPAGQRALGGGGATHWPGAGVSVTNSFPLPSGTGWLVTANAKTPGAGWDYVAYAVCATVAP